MIDVLSVVTVVWILALVTWALYKKFTLEKKEIDFIANINKKLINLEKKVNENQEEATERLSAFANMITKIEKNNEDHRKVVEEAKKVITQNSLVGAFVPRSKRVEVGN